MVNVVNGEEPMKIFDADTMNAPWGLITKLKTAVSAIRFFNPQNLAESRHTIGRGPDGNRPLSLMDFVRYLEKPTSSTGGSPTCSASYRLSTP